jgi:hypothetical protein
MRKCWATKLLSTATVYMRAPGMNLGEKGKRLKGEEVKTISLLSDLINRGDILCGLCASARNLFISQRRRERRD